MYKPPVNISDQRWSERIHTALPAFMNQNDNSNNQKVLSIYTDYGNAYKNDILDYTDETLVQHASGQMLDRLCADWGVNIVDENDDEFKKFQIRFQMLRHRLGPGTNDIKGAIEFLFNIPENAFNIISTGIKAIKIVNLPFNFDTGDKNTLKHELIAKYIRGMMPPEYELCDVEYQASAEIWLYQGIEAPKSPIYESVQQYVSGLEVDADTWFLHHAWHARGHNASQQLPPIHEEVNAEYYKHHAKRFKYINATQNRKDQ